MSGLILSFVFTNVCICHEPDWWVGKGKGKEEKRRGKEG
jgi:hypothetical protein